MKPIITLCLAMPLMVLSLESRAQQLTPAEAAKSSSSTSQAVRINEPHIADVTQADQAPQFNKFDSGGHYLGAQRPDPGAYSPQLEARSRRIFPDVGRESERRQWMADQERRAIANEINRSKTRLYPASVR